MHITFLETNKRIHRRALDVRYFISKEKYVHVHPGWDLYIVDKEHWPCNHDKEHKLCSIYDMSYVAWKQHEKVSVTRNK